eukprot:Trichotokara_eunicae@DN2844_c0_g1_i1.p1
MVDEEKYLLLPLIPLLTPSGWIDWNSKVTNVMVMNASDEFVHRLRLLNSQRPENFACDAFIKHLVSLIPTNHCETIGMIVRSTVPYMAAYFGEKKDVEKTCNALLRWASHNQNIQKGPSVRNVNNQNFDAILGLLCLRFPNSCESFEALRALNMRLKNVGRSSKSQKKYSKLSSAWLGFKETENQISETLKNGR